MMPKLYACIISFEGAHDRQALVAVAGRFAHGIEVLEDGILFDVSGLERLIGKSEQVAQKILAELKKSKVKANVAVADTVDTAMLLARQGAIQSASFSLSRAEKQTEACILNTLDMFEHLPLASLDIERDTLNVFNELGFRSVGNLLSVPHNDLIDRYGKKFTDVIDVLEQKGRSLITPNVKENQASWSYDLDMAVEDFEQLIFLLNHGLESLFNQIANYGFSTEHLDITFKLTNKKHRQYEIKTSFPTLERSFWLKLVNLRISLNPPGAEIKSIHVKAYFTRPRPNQRGLYAVSWPEPESLLLTVNKLKKLVGEENVGLPVLLNQRLAKPFTLNTDAIPEVKDRRGASLVPPSQVGIIGLIWYNPSLRAEVLVRDGRLILIKTRYFSGYVVEYSGVWKSNSKWWDTAWKTQEWDVEVEDYGLYRLCKAGEEWFLRGEYD